MLEINNIIKIYSNKRKRFTALDDISIKVEKGDFITVVGASGSGKSTLLHTIGGLIHPDSGQVLYRGKDIYALSHHDANLHRRKNVGFVFQQFHLLPYLTVYENIRLADGAALDNLLLEYYLEKCGLNFLRNKYPKELSVGEKQRTAFIRAMVKEPEILLADEPTGNLDPENSEVLISLISEYHKKGGTVLLVSHMPEISKYSNRTVTLRTGRILADELN